MFHEHTKFRERSRKFATGGNENYYEAPVCPTGNRRSIEKYQDFVVAIRFGTSFASSSVEAMLAETNDPPTTASKLAQAREHPPNEEIIDGDAAALPDRPVVV